MEPPRQTDDPVLRMADAVGGLIEFWGFKRHMGRTWTLLYLEARPLSAADLGARLSMSAGAVSMTLSDLQKWGVVKKTWVPGQRRDYYEPETSIWKMVSRVFRERELVQIQVAIEAFQSGATELAEQLRRASGSEAGRIQSALDRVKGLLSLARTGETLVRAMLSGQAIDATPLKNFVLDNDE